MHLNPDVAEFMDHFRHEGLTFDDVTLLTRFADFLPAEAGISTRLTSRISLNIPFVSAAMDTVTEAEMAIAMAMLGGIGVIHKNLSPEAQTQKVRLVKHHLNGLILQPVAFRNTDTIDKIQQVRHDQNLSFSGFPILDAQDRLVGILTSSDIRYAVDPNADVREVMTSKVITAPPETSLEQAYETMMHNKIGKLPLVDQHGRLVGLYSFTDVKSLVDNKKPQYTRDERYRLRVAAAVGPNDHARIEQLASEDVDVIVVDSAHGHSQGILDIVQWTVRRFPDLDVIAGNVATGEGAAALRDAGAHAVKVGIGPGSICTTRVICGVGIPQLTAVYQASRALDNEIPIVADGGIRHSGDVPKAVCVGADSVMLGSILAGTQESPGEKIIHEGRHYVVYRGMGSLAAMQEASGSRERYAQASSDPESLVPQGIEGVVPFAGTVKKVMTQFCGGLRAALGYCGCRDLDALKRHGRFCRVSLAGVREAHPHDVKVIKEAPNYRS